MSSISDYSVIVENAWFMFYKKNVVIPTHEVLFIPMLTCLEVHITTTNTKHRRQYFMSLWLPNAIITIFNLIIATGLTYFELLILVHLNMVEIIFNS